MFQYDFVRTAFIVGGFLALILPLLGVTVVLKRLSMIGDALSHVALSGVSLGLILGFNPLVGAIVISLVAALSINTIQKHLGSYQELAIAIIMSFGIGLSGVLLGFVNNPNNFNAYLFGSIVSINQSDNLVSIALSILVIGIAIRYYREFFFIAFDEKSAKLSGISINKMNFIFLFLTAITVAIGSRVVGALVVSSLMVLPVALAMRVSKSYKTTVLYSMIFSLIFMWLGLTLSYYFDLRPGGTIVLTAVAGYLISFLFVRNK
ncbi:metal ABC transporter permease [Erysipelothrix urinaevulpis]|uniref:metal ABC transporter permease n=1 Tax=Erysipelothrix urinaevulpis TaxID=2683717 RepID=UPI00135A56F3|nr:metal ABC transporter permease [Erysipelothrix urinaevulpis]